ncbi:hypothetical protein LINPERHAP1_LOCUS8025, partial [Linum perenne]
HIHTSTTQLTIHSFTVTDINQAQPTNPSTSTHNQVPLHLHPFIWTHTYSTMHTRHINHNHTFIYLCEFIRRHWSLPIHHPCRPDAP